MKVLVLNFRTPSTKFFFALIKKIFLQTLVEIIFRYHKIFFQGSGTPLGPPTTKMKIFACEVMGIKIESEGCFEFISEGIFGKYSKMKVLVLNFGTPSTKFFFALIKKIFLQTLVEIILRYHKIFLGFWDPLGPPYEANKNFCM